MNPTPMAKAEAVILAHNLTRTDGYSLLSPYPDKVVGYLCPIHSNGELAHLIEVVADYGHNHIPRGRTVDNVVEHLLDGCTSHRREQSEVIR